MQVVKLREIWDPQPSTSYRSPRLLSFARPQPHKLGLGLGLVTVLAARPAVDRMARRGARQIVCGLPTLIKHMHVDQCRY